MPKRIYIEGLPARFKEGDVRTMVAPYGTIESVSKDARQEGAFIVAMTSGADEAIQALNGAPTGPGQRVNTYGLD